MSSALTRCPPRCSPGSSTGKHAPPKAKRVCTKPPPMGKERGVCIYTALPRAICLVVGAGRWMEPAPRLLARWEVVPGSPA